MECCSVKYSNILLNIYIRVICFSQQWNTWYIWTTTTISASRSGTPWTMVLPLICWSWTILRAQSGTRPRTLLRSTSSTSEITGKIGIMSTLWWFGWKMNSPFNIGYCPLIIIVLQCWMAKIQILSILQFSCHLHFWIHKACSICFS